MRFNINLASQPYEDSRQFWVYWGAALGLLALVTAALVYFAVIGFMEGASDRHQISQLRAEVDRLDQEKLQAQAMLNRPDNRIVRDRSRFLNQLFEQKSLSWTLIFEQLEEVMPAHLHVISIQPGFTEENDLQLKLVVGGDTREQADDLVRKMEKSRHFRPGSTHIVAEKFSAAGNGKKDRVEFDIEALYVPAAPSPASHGGSD
jgi:type IV pilus assembly protein PilN